MKKILVLLSVIAILFVACEDDSLSYEEQLAIDIEKIQTYIVDSSLTAQSTESGLYYIIEEEGTGNYPTVDSTVNITYTGMFLDGEEFDSGTIEYELGAFILGWQEGVPLFKEGGSGRLFIPSGLGYGSEDYRGISKNSVLMFDIELLEISN